MLKVEIECRKLKFNSTFCLQHAKNVRVYFIMWQLQVQSSKYPEFEAQSLSETFYYLRQAIHYMNPEQESLSFSYRQYRENKFIIGMSFEKMHGNEGVSFTG